MATETHIAGLQLQIGDRYMIQRCAWCGATMCAYDLTRVAVMNEPDGSPGKPPAMFGVGGLVRFSYEGTVASFGEVALALTTKEALDLEELPDDACTKHIPFEGGGE